MKRYPCVRIVPCSVGWAVYACPTQFESRWIGCALYAKDAVRMAFGYLAAAGLTGWAVRKECR